MEIISANRNFYRTLKVTPGETIGSFIYDLGNKQWDIPELRELLETILPQKTTFDDYEVEHDFADIGRHTMLLNARQIQRVWGKERIILLTIEDITERKRLEDLLTESEVRFRRLFETASDGIVLLEKGEEKITHANPSTEKMLGYTNKESIGNKLQDIGVSLDMDNFQTTMQNLNKSGILNYDDVPVETKSGRNIDTDIYLVDRATLVQCNIRDITERKLAENEREKMLLWQEGVNLLQQSLLAPSKLEEKLRAITDCIVSLFDADFSRIWLIQPGDLCEQGCIHADVHEGPHICLYRDQCLHLLVSSGRYTHTDGTIHRRVPFGCYKIGRVASDNDHKFLTNNVWNDPRIHDHEWARKLGLVSFAGYQLRVPGGNILGVLALFAKHPISTPEDAMLDGLSSTVALVIQRDIAEKSLELSEQKYRNIFENAIEGIFQSTPEGRFLSVNSSFARMTGYGSPEEMMESITDIGSQLYANPEDRAKFKRRINEHGVVENLEVRHYGKDGSVIWGSINARSVRDEHGTLIYFEGTFEDITKRKKAEEGLIHTMDNLRKSMGSIIQVVAAVLETRDPYTAGHQKRVANLARAIATEMGLSSESIEGVRTAGMIHDIGKISVPAEILSKPGKLTNLELDLIKTHSQVGYDILKGIEFPWPIANIIYQHHERLDGSGYPQGLKDGDICLEAKIISVADVVEAIASHRPYRAAKGIDVALDEIEKNKGILYDAVVVEACLHLCRERSFKLI